MTEVHDPLLEPMVFTDPASGERIIVTFRLPQSEPTQLPPSADRAAGSSGAPDPTGRRAPKRTEDLDAKITRSTISRI